MNYIKLLPYFQPELEARLPYFLPENEEQWGEGGELEQKLAPISHFCPFSPSRSSLQSILFNC